VYLLVFTHIFTGILIFKGLTERRLFNSFGVKGLTSVLKGDEWAKPQEAALHSGNIQGTYCTRGWVGPRASLIGCGG
jgi:hypothetical protein